MKLYHYCCKHSVEAIRESGVLRPPPEISWARYDLALMSVGSPPSRLHPAPYVVWLTDLASPDRYGLGLTSNTIRCDRTRYRVEVATDVAVPWSDFVREHGASPLWLANLHRLGKPDRWWVATERIPVATIASAA